MADSQDRSNEAKLAVRLLESVGWTDYLYPKITRHCGEVLNSLATSKSEQDDIKRGWVQALNWVANLPKTEIDEQRQYEDELERDKIDQTESELEASLGRRSPFVATQEVNN